MTLKEKREAMGFNVPALAENLGVSVKELMTWENDEASCPYGRMLVLALEFIAIEADGSLERMGAALDAELSRADAREAVDDEYWKLHDAWWAEHNRWLKANGMPEVEYKQ
jgi:transcriptional regulator with XRE-family HTH domain